MSAWLCSNPIPAFCPRCACLPVRRLPSTVWSVWQASRKILSVPWKQANCPLAWLRRLLKATWNGSARSSKRWPIRIFSSGSNAKTSRQRKPKFTAPQPSLPTGFAEPLPTRLFAMPRRNANLRLSRSGSKRADINEQVDGTRYDAMPPGTFSFHMNVPVKLEGGLITINIPVDAVVMPLTSSSRRHAAVD